MKKYILSIILISLVSVSLFSQKESNLNNFSFDVGYGMNIPFIQSGDVPGTESAKSTDYITPISTSFGLRYHLTDRWALRGSYSLNGFKRRGNAQVHSYMHKLTLDAPFTIFRQKGKNKSNDFVGFGLDGKAGVGLTFNKVINTDFIDHIGNVQFGLEPSYYFNAMIGLFLDFEYVINIRQHQGFIDKSGSTDDISGKIGSYSIIHLGLKIRMRKPN